MASYDFDYTIQVLRQAIDFAEIEHDFVPLRKWVNEVEQSGHELEAVEARLNASVGKELLQEILGSVATGSLSPQEALQHIHGWLVRGTRPRIEAEFIQQYQLA